ncbi:MAG: RNase P modulator RnpM [Deltaproteobacteria bacterium]
MKTKKIPNRMCIGCREMKPKKELLRIVKSQEGIISIDTTGKKPGRGAYICFNIECLDKAQKGKRIEKEFETAVSLEIYSNLRRELNQINDK